MTQNFFIKFINKTIFYKKYYYIIFKKLLKNMENPNYLVIEFVASKSENYHHIPNAFQILKTHYENIENVVSKKKVLIINNGTIGSRFYFDYLTKLGYVCYILKNGWR